MFKSVYSEVSWSQYVLFLGAVSQQNDCQITVSFLKDKERFDI